MTEAPNSVTLAAERVVGWVTFVLKQVRAIARRTVVWLTKGVVQVPPQSELYVLAAAPIRGTHMLEKLLPHGEPARAV